MEIYTIKVAVKPYVKAYLENNFGTPIDFRKDSELTGIVNLMLRAGSAHLDNIVSAKFAETVEIRISKDTFFRHGFTLTKTDTIRFNSFLEKRLKYYARLYISYHNSLGFSITKCIRDFQDTFGFSEDVWSYDSIKKDFDRHGAPVGKNIIMNFQAELSKVFMEKLSELGTTLKPVGS